jgi:hypothetical protein
MSSPEQDQEHAEWRGRHTTLVEGLDNKFDIILGKLDEHVKDDNRQFELIDGKLSEAQGDSRRRHSIAMKGVSDLNSRVAKWSGALIVLIPIALYLLPKMFDKIF